MLSVSLTPKVSLFQGICHNNIAITKMEMALRATDTSVRARDFGLAKEHFEMGITTARDIAVAAEPEGSSLLAAKLVIATRLCNLATCLNLERNLDAIRSTGVAAASEATELAAEVSPGSTKELDARCMLASLHTALGSPEAEQHWQQVDTPDASELCTRNIRTTRQQTRFISASESLTSKAWPRALWPARRNRGVAGLT